MKAIGLIKESVQFGRNYFEGTMADVTEKMIHVSPGGTAHPLGATYAHLVISEDWIVNTVMQGKIPLASAKWKGKVGVDNPMPYPGPEWKKYAKWANTVRIDLVALKKFAKAVYQNTDSYIQTLNDTDLDKQLDLSYLGFGKVNVGWALIELISGHYNNMVGEIAVLKGLQGAKGYPF